MTAVNPSPDQTIITQKSAPPDLDDWIRRFRMLHEASEKCYNGDGSWGAGYSDWGSLIDSTCTHPLVRQTGRRLLGYIDAYRVAPEPIYRQRISEAAEHLLREQNPDGSFPWWINDTGTTVGTPQYPIYGGATNLLYETAIAGCGLIRAYEFSRDNRYSDASRIATFWSMACPYSGNNNYEAFAVWHQTLHYRITRERPAFLTAVKRTMDNVLIDQKPDGGWPEHNSFVWYHAIIIRGLATLLGVMPPEYPVRDRIHHAASLAINHLLSLIEPEGCLRASAEYDLFTDMVELPLMALIVADPVFSVDMSGPIHRLAGRMARNIARSIDRVESKRPQRLPASENDPLLKPLPILELRVAAAGAYLRYLGEHQPPPDSGASAVQ